MDGATAAWASLSEPWRLAVTEAWESWAAGSAGVGAVLTDDAGRVVVRGRNRMAEPSSGRLGGTVMAHAEMDVLSQVPLGVRPSGALYTTFEPCLMCAATILLYRVPEVHYAAADPVFDGLHDWFRTYPFTAPGGPGAATSGVRSAPSAMSFTSPGWSAGRRIRSSALTATWRPGISSARRR